jgi:Gas vesicle protein
MTTPQQRPREQARRRGASRARRVSLSETLDRVLHKGAVLTGDLVISVADVELIYISLNALVASIDTVRDWAEASRETREAPVPRAEAGVP